jgi:acetate kinase
MTPADGHRVLVLNAGSSSLKFAVFEGLGRIWHGQVEGIGTHPQFAIAGASPAAAHDLPPDTRHAAGLSQILEALAARGIAPDQLAACGHRIVHGGSRFTAPTLVSEVNLGELNALRTLAPLHNGYGLDAIEALRSQAPKLPQVACFDTAFHATVPQVAARYALPATLHEAGYRRFGFHGLNFEHVTAVAAERLGGHPPARLLIFHLGNGSSLCAVKDRRSVATTMGYSTLDGLVMGTRCGAIDPGVLISLQRDRGMSVDEIENLLYRRCGILAVSGRTSDMRELLQIDEPAARFAVEHFCYWAARHAGSLAVAMQGLDAVAFTGGIGSGSPEIRQRIITHLEWLGLALDADRNLGAEDSLELGGSRVKIWRIEADEELAIARHVHAVLA